MSDDGLPEDRVRCRDCRQFGGRFHCDAYDTSTLPDLQRRCLAFVPRAGAADPRTGEERWPTLKQDIDELRAMDQAHGGHGHG